MKTDLWLSPRPPETPALLVVGCMNFGARTPEREARAVIDRALERGLRAFDTANMYGNGKSERIVGQALANVSDARIATKIGLFPTKQGPEGLAPERVVAAVDASLERLGRKSLELVYLHAPDRLTPLNETLGAVHDLMRAGKIEHFGISNFSAWETLELVLACDALQMPRPRTSQVLYNLAIRQIDVEYVRFAQKYALHTTVYNPLAGGLFARDSKPGDAPPQGSRFATTSRYRNRYWTDRLMVFAEACRSLAAEFDRTGLELAYGWLAQRVGVDSILMGPATPAHVDAAVDAVARPLVTELIVGLDKLQREFDGTDAAYAR